MGLRGGACIALMKSWKFKCLNSKRSVVGAPNLKSKLEKLRQVKCERVRFGSQVTADSNTDTPMHHYKLQLIVLSITQLCPFK